jgi:hypothetical protein
MVHTLNVVFSVLMRKMCPVQDLMVLLQAIAFVKNSPKRLVAFDSLQQITGTVELFKSLQENTVMVDVKMNNITDYIFNHSVTQDGV